MVHVLAAMNSIKLILLSLYSGHAHNDFVLNAERKKNQKEVRGELTGWLVGASGQLRRGAQVMTEGRI